MNIFNQQSGIYLISSRVRLTRGGTSVWLMGKVSTTLRLKTYDITKHFTRSRTLAASLVRRNQWKRAQGKDRWRALVSAITNLLSFTELADSVD